MAEILKCTQSNVAQMERDFKDLSEEQIRILSDKYGESEILKFTLIDAPNITPRKKQYTDNEYQNNIDSLLIEQQKSISDLIDMVKNLQAENSKLINALLQQKIV